MGFHSGSVPSGHRRRGLWQHFVGGPDNLARYVCSGYGYGNLRDHDHRGTAS